MIKKTTCKLALVLLVVFATGVGLNPSATGAVEATSAIENSVVSEIDSPAGAGSGDPNLSVGPDGPAISSAGQNVAVAWFTAARDQLRVYTALSADGGATFGPQILVAEGNPLGRVDIIALPSGNAFVSWVERTPGGSGVHARIVKPDGTKAPEIIVAETSSGFPHMKMSGDEVVIAWTDSRNARKVRTAILRITGN